MLIPPQPANLIHLDSHTQSRLERLRFVMRRFTAGERYGNRRSLRRGASLEFADYREYANGDDLRYLDWNAYARLEKLYVKQFLDEQETGVHLLLDTSASMGFGAPVTKRDLAAGVLGMLGFVALSGGDHLSAASMHGGAADILPARRGRSGYAGLAHFLATAAPSAGGGDLARSVGFYADRIRPGAIVAIASDFFDDGAQRAIRILRARGALVIALQVLSVDEVAPALGGDVRLEESESDSVWDMQISEETLRDYAGVFADFEESLRVDVERAGGRLYRLTTSDTAERFVMGTLRKDGVLR